MPRRDKCFLVAKRGLRLKGVEAILAWRDLCMRLEAMGLMPQPKFRDVLGAVRSATIHARTR